MSISGEMWLIIALLLLYMDVFIIWRLLVNRVKNNKSNKLVLGQNSDFSNTENVKSSYFRNRALTSDYLKVKQTIQLDKHKRESIEKNVDIA